MLIVGGHGFRMLESTFFLLIRLCYRRLCYRDYVIANLSALFRVHPCTKLNIRVARALILREFR